MAAPVAGVAAIAVARSHEAPKPARTVDWDRFAAETRRKAEFLEKGVRPPLLADPLLKNEPASIMPGSITYVRDVRLLPAFEVSPKLLRLMRG